MPDSIIKTNNLTTLNGLQGPGVPDGSPLLPGFNFSNDTDSGLYRISENKIGITAGGVKVGEFGPDYGGFTGNIIQVISVAKTNTFSSIITTFVDIPGLSITITPKSVNNKILIFYNTSIGIKEGYYSAGVRIARNNSPIYIGDATAGSQARASSWAWSDNNWYSILPINGSFLDSPSTISSITYSLQTASGYAGETFFINKNKQDSGADGFQYGRPASNFLVMEVMQ